MKITAFSYFKKYDNSDYNSFICISSDIKFY